jgi:hypothetical protein
MTPSEQKELIKAIGQFVCDEISTALRPLRMEIMQLSFKIDNAEMKVRNLRYCGVWNDRSVYAEGNLITHSGSLWHSNIAENRTMPGADPVAWTLCVKKGADAPYKAA